MRHPALLVILLTPLLAVCGESGGGISPSADVPPADVFEEDGGVDIGGEDRGPDALDTFEDSAPPPPATEMVWQGGAPTVPRLTSLQFERAIHDLFGEEVVVPSHIEPDPESGGFIQIGVANATISPRGVEKFEEAAYEIADQALTLGVPALEGCGLEPGPDDGCAETYLAELAYRAWRRPPLDAEVSALVELAGSAAEVLGSFRAGMEFGIAAVIQSPNFLFRVELGTPDPEVPGLRRYDDYELASRLSFLLWDTLPDEELLAAAAAGELTDDEGLRAQASRLLEDPRATRGLLTFFEELYELHKLHSVDKDPTIFPSFAPDLIPSALEETRRVLEEHVMVSDGDFREIFTTRRTYLNRRLAALYDVRAPAAEGFAAVELPAGELRGGLLGHASVLALTSHVTSTSATLRGVWIRENVLCSPIPPPPSGVDTSIPEASGEVRTLRDRVQRHLEDPSCSGCHSLMDPLGLALENFDGIGAYRTLDNGELIDGSGSLDGAEFDGFDGLIELLAQDRRTTRCVVQKLYRYASGRLEDPDQVLQLEALHELFEHDGFRVKALVLHFVMSPAFRLAGEIE